MTKKDIKNLVLKHLELKKELQDASEAFSKEMRVQAAYSRAFSAIKELIEIYADCDFYLDELKQARAHLDEYADEFYDNLLDAESAKRAAEDALNDFEFVHEEDLSVEALEAALSEDATEEEN